MAVTFPMLPASAMLPQGGSKSLHKILNKINPSEATRAEGLNQSMQSAMFDKALIRDGVFQLDENENLVVKEGFTPFPSMNNIYDLYLSEAKKRRVKPNQGEFLQLYQGMKQMYDTQLSGKLNAVTAAGYDQDAVYEAIGGHIPLNSYINSNAAQNPSFAPYSTAAMMAEPAGWEEVSGGKLMLGSAGLYLGNKFVKSRGEKNIKAFTAKKGLKITEKAITGSGKGLTARFLRNVSKAVGPKLAKKLAIRLAGMPVKGVLGPVGWALLAADLVMLGPEIYDAVKAIYKSTIGGPDYQKSF